MEEGSNADSLRKGRANVLLRQERELIAEYGRKLITSGLTRGTGGNISIYNRQEKLMAISPSSLDYLQTRPEDVVVTTVHGEIIEGGKKTVQRI